MDHYESTVSVASNDLYGNGEARLECRDVVGHVSHELVPIVIIESIATMRRRRRSTIIIQPANRQGLVESNFPCV
jgi:hypothetical protein